VHSPRNRCLKWLKRLLKRISKYEGRLGYWERWVLKQSLNWMTKEASVDYDKAGHKLAINWNQRKWLPAKALTYISTTYPIRKSKKRLKLQMIKVITYEAEIKIDGKDCDLIFWCFWEILKKRIIYFNSCFSIRTSFKQGVLIFLSSYPMRFSSSTFFYFFQ
jgi:hypothetical protein